MDKNKIKAIIKIPVYIAAVLVIGVLSGHFTFKLLSFSKTVTVPDIRGKTIIDATDTLRAKGLYVRLEGEDYDSYIYQGGIIRQDMPPGSKVKEGREVGVVLSKGPRVQYVPDVIGQTVERAESILNDKGIKIGKIIYVHSVKTPKNVILAQRPETNESSGDAFKIIVSAGDTENKLYSDNLRRKGD